MEFKVEVPGSYKLVDHSILRAFNKGALGELKVEGPENQAIYSGKQAESDYHAKTVPATQPASAAPMKAPGPAGETLFKTYCMGCHQAEGQGMPGTFPPLAKSDYLMTDKSRVIETVLNGLTGPIQVNGQNYNGVMPPMGNLKDAEIADILSYVLSAWGNSGGSVSAADVAAVRAKTAH